MTTLPPFPAGRLRCADVSPYLAAFADGELAEPLRAQVAAHVESCESCSRQLARYTAVDALLARLPRTEPSAAVYERVAVAVAGRERLPAVRESLSGRRPVLRRRRLEFAEWANSEAADGIGPREARPRARRRWSSGALPAIAAVLLVALTALTIHGAMGGSRPGPSDTPVTPPPSGTALQQTQAQMQRAVGGRNMGFTPVYPSYLPDGPVFQTVSAQVTPGGAGSGAAMLDVTWTLSGTVQQVHLREGARATRWTGYVSAPTRTGLTWQVGPFQWTPLSVGDSSGPPAVGEDRGGVWLALDATVSAGDPMNQQAVALLRLISLSMDVPYQQDPQQIIPAPSSTAFHYTGDLETSGGTVYSVDGYDAEAQQDASITLSRNGTPYYTDVVSGQQGIRLDPAHRTYQPYPPAQLTPAALVRGVTQVFFGATTLAQNGDLWNVGPTTYRGASVYNFQWVDEPSVTHVYVDRQSNQVIAVVVDASSGMQPGGPAASSWYAGSAGCTSFTTIEALSSAQTPHLSAAPPANYAQGQVPATISC